MILECHEIVATIEIAEEEVGVKVEAVETVIMIVEEAETEEIIAREVAEEIEIMK